MDQKITTDNPLRPELTWESTDNIGNLVYNSLTIAKGAFPKNLAFGSRRHEIKKMTDRNVSLLKLYDQEALQWLLDTGKATAITVKTEKGGPNRINEQVTLTQKDGLVLVFDHFIEVG